MRSKSHVYQLWNKGEVDTACRLYADGRTFAQIAEHVGSGRTAKGVACKMAKVYQAGEGSPEFRELYHSRLKHLPLARRSRSLFARARRALSVLMGH
jgi:hypothetical protein